MWDISGSYIGGKLLNVQIRKEVENHKQNFLDFINPEKEKLYPKQAERKSQMSKDKQ